MKTEKNILVAFILNIAFSIFEFFGGFFTGSVAILSDSIHDLGDAMSIGVSYFFERKSKKKPDNKYSYGYSRYSVIGSLFTTLVLLIGSVLVIYGAINRIINPVEINYNGMIIFGIFGVIVNFLAALFTKDGDSVNQKAVNLHMLEDVLGWIVVLTGAVIMKFTHNSFTYISLLDPIMSIGVALFILIATIKNLFETVELLLEKTPDNIDIEEIKEHINSIEGVISSHHIHVWTLDGTTNLVQFEISAPSFNPLNVTSTMFKSSYGISTSTTLQPQLASGINAPDRVANPNIGVNSLIFFILNPFILVVCYMPLLY